MVDMMMLLITFFMLCTSLSKPQSMQLTMPSNDKNVNEQDRSATKASQTLTLYLAGNDQIYHVDGIPQYDNPACLKKTTWGADGIRSVLINHRTEGGYTPVKNIMAAKKLLDSEVSDMLIKGCKIFYNLLLNILVAHKSLRQSTGHKEVCKWITKIRKLI